MKTSLQADAESFIREHGVPGADYQREGLFDEWRSQFSPASDGIELFTAWERALDATWADPFEVGT